MTNAILETFPLSSGWLTLDPFLMCAHHVDAYPAANGRLGPAAALDDRPIGGDFSGSGGWNMYHGSTVPGFPQHPHRGFETITYLRSGWCDHADSLGGEAASDRATPNGSPQDRASFTPKCSPSSIQTDRTHSISSRSGSTSQQPTRWPNPTSHCCGQATPPP